MASTPRSRRETAVGMIALYFEKCDVDNWDDETKAGCAAELAALLEEIFIPKGFNLRPADRDATEA